jgi:hypothetical protein
VSHDAPAGHEFSQWILQQSAEDPAFTVEVLFTDECHASLELGSPAFTTNVCGQRKILLRFDLTINIVGFPSVFGLEF